MNITASASGALARKDAQNTTKFLGSMLCAIPTMMSFLVVPDKVCVGALRLPLRNGELDEAAAGEVADNDDVGVVDVDVESEAADGSKE